MTPTAVPAQVVHVPRGQSSAKRKERLTLPCTDYEHEAVRAVAVHRGILTPVATRHGSRVKGRGAVLLRSMPLTEIVAEYERLKAAGEL